MWPDCYTELSPRVLPVLWGCKRMELIGPLENPPQICTDYLHEAEFAQRNILLFVWLILFGKGWRKLPGTAWLLCAWTLQGKQLWMWGCAAGTWCGLGSQCRVDQGWEQALCPGFPDVCSLAATTAPAKELAKISRQKRNKKTLPQTWMTEANLTL